MPELPEVENVKLSLTSLGTVGQCFDQVELRRKDLRVPFPKGLARDLKGQTLLSIQRRAKYLLFETEKYFLLSHLGMTGSWRPLNSSVLKAHDHVILKFASGLELVFNDPRRFGILDLVVRSKLQDSRWLKHLGVEPLTKDWTGEILFQGARKMKGPIKGFLMDQRRVVGVGNIYASEALYASGVRPQRSARLVTRAECERIVSHVQRILNAAIHAGGSTIRDYRNSNGESGRFQNQFQVYGRAGEPCHQCGTLIRAKVIAGRNTFWCPQCQR